MTLDVVGCSGLAPLRHRQRDHAVDPADLERLIFDKRAVCGRSGLGRVEIALEGDCRSVFHLRCFERDDGPSRFRMHAYGRRADSGPFRSSRAASAWTSAASATAWRRVHRRAALDGESSAPGEAGARSGASSSRATASCAATDLGCARAAYLPRAQGHLAGGAGGGAAPARAGAARAALPRAQHGLEPRRQGHADWRTKGLFTEVDRRLFHHLRTQADAVMVGAGTVREERYGRMTKNYEPSDKRVAEGRAPEALAVVAEPPPRPAPPTFRSSTSPTRRR